jgi:hypothetical protein
MGVLSYGFTRRRGYASNFLWNCRGGVSCHDLCHSYVGGCPTLDARINELMVKAQNVVLAEQCHVSEWAGSAETAIVSAAGQAAVDSMLDMNAAVARMQRDIAIFRRGVTSEVGANALRDPLLTANLKREMPDFARFP